MTPYKSTPQSPLCRTEFVPVKAKPDTRTARTVYLDAILKTSEESLAALRRALGQEGQK